MGLIDMMLRLPAEVGTEVVAASLKVTTPTVTRWIKAGKCPAKKIGHHYRVPTEWLDIAVEKGTEAANEFWKSKQ